ncbi:ATP-binding protein [Bacteriovorax sp. PP10]|uniref:histidine kinase n=1 Tax=Bacteriovorax antarcticus TaxID=3088717 RepID=A0ABU5VQK0_9BACT|nr:ATP-binding protein [Bacteriovorax sp. PP10]MEA9355309.1 ATP-binding protein [Bacteriovorax sp. PP10]
MKTLLSNKIFRGLMLALALPSLALFLQISLEFLNNSREWLFFYPAIFATAWFGGARYGYVATFLCVFLSIFFLIPPIYSFKILSYASFIEISIFTLMGLSISFMMGKILSKYIVASEHSEELEKSTEYLDSLLDHIPMTVFVKDAKDLRFTHLNKAGEELLGFDRSELIGKSDFDFFPKEQAEHFTQVDKDVIAGKHVVDTKEELIQTKHHGTRVLHTKKIPLFAKDGNPQYLLGVSEDITDKKNAEEEMMRMIKEEAALKEREIATAKDIFLAKVSTLLSTTLDYKETLNMIANLAVTALGDWCTISMINDEGQFERAAGAHADKKKTPLLEEYMANYLPDQRVNSVNGDSSFYNYQISNSELKAMIKDKRQLELLLELGANSSMIVPIKARGKVRGSLSFIAGTSKPNFSALDLALAEDFGRRAGIAIENALLYSAAQSAIRARDEFVSIASHELKTPITSLKMQLQMMLRGINIEKNQAPPPEKLLKALTSSTKQIDRLTVLIEDLLDVTRIETGKLTYKFEKVDLSLMVKEIMDRYAEEAKYAKTEFKQNLQENVISFCDRYRIEQVFINLLSNAIKYGSNNPVEVTVTSTPGKAIIIVKDQGLGIAKEMQGKIFERFERAISSTNISGLGLGLYITKQIIDAHQGTIEVESDLNIGSTFKVCLPTGL